MFRKFAKAIGNGHNYVIEVESHDSHHGNSHNDYEGNHSEETHHHEKTEHSNYHFTEHVSHAAHAAHYTAMYLSLLVAGLGILLSFRNVIFQTLFEYKPVKERTKYRGFDSYVGRDLYDTIRKNSLDKDLMKKIESALNITKNHLSFSLFNAKNDPNELISYKKAHCVGYASFFQATLLELLKPGSNIEINHLVGKVYFLGIDLHQFTSSPYFIDHDYVMITDYNSGNKYYVDPSLYDLEHDL